MGTLWVTKFELGMGVASWLLVVRKCSEVVWVDWSIESIELLLFLLRLGISNGLGGWGPIDRALSRALSKCSEGDKSICSKSEDKFVSKDDKGIGVDRKEVEG